MALGYVGNKSFRGIPTPDDTVPVDKRHRPTRTDEQLRGALEGRYPGIFGKMKRNKEVGQAGRLGAAR